MEQEKFNEFKLKVLKRVTDQFLLRKNIMPTLYFVNNLGARKIMEIPTKFLNSKNMKQILSEILSEMLSSVKAQASCVVFEGWMVVASSDDDIDTDIRPSQHPDKQEVITFSFECKDCEAEMITLINKDGNLTPLKVNEGGGVASHSAGIFQNILK